MSNEGERVHTAIQIEFTDRTGYDLFRIIIRQLNIMIKLYKKQGIKAINIEAKLKAGASPNVPYKFDRTKYDYTYTVVDNTENETRKWNDKMYVRVINRDEISRNNLLVQNPGY